MGAPKSAPTPIITRRVPQSVFAAAIKPINAPSAMKTMKMSFLILSSRIQPTPDGIRFKPASTHLLHFHRKDLLPAVPNSARRW
jgi:hypothetical protein